MKQKLFSYFISHFHFCILLPKKKKKKKKDFTMISTSCVRRYNIFTSKMNVGRLISKENRIESNTKIIAKKIDSGYYQSFS